MPQTSMTTKGTTTTGKTSGTGWELRCEDGNKVPYACGFVIRNHDWNELVRFARDHAKNTHQMEFSEAQVKQASKQVTW